MKHQKTPLQSRSPSRATRRAVRPGRVLVEAVERRVLMSGVGIPTSLVFTAQPTSATAGNSLGTVTVSIEDSLGNVVTTDGSTVTLSTTAPLTGTTSVAAVGGVATFSGLSIAAVASGYTLSASDGALAPATSSSFAVVPDYTDTKLADLSSSLGKYPEGQVVDGSGNVYGVTNQGGANNHGAVYKIAAGTGAVTLLASFGAESATSGVYPQAGLTLDSSGNLYGTTSLGGTNDTGVIFEIPAGTTTINTLASFPAGSSNSSANDAMAIDSNGDLFGTVRLGGASGYGYVFELPAGSSTINPLASFNGTNGADPYGSVVRDANGNLYGTTNGGGADGDGTVFQVAANSGAITTLAAFDGTDGQAPLDTPVLDASGNLYGTTVVGGAYSEGTVFEVAAGSGAITTLASFNGSDGDSPQRGRLVMDGSGDLFGTTSAGGTASDGTAFELPAGTGTIVTIADFTTATGDAPQIGLATNASGDLYGTTEGGAGNGVGSVFELTPAYPATHAAFAQQPTAVTAGAAQSVTVDLDAPGGQVDATNASTVTLSIASGPAGATLGGTTTATATGGVVNFSGLTFDEAGTYTLTATANGLTAATSAAITSSAATATQLVFAAQPTSAATGASLGTVVVNVEDAYGNLVTTDASTVTVSGTGLTGTTSVAAVGGVATFTGLSVSQGGTFTLAASDGALSPAASNPVTITALTPTTTVVAGNNIPQRVIAPATAFADGGAGSKSLTARIESADGKVVATRRFAVRHGKAVIGNIHLQTAGQYTMAVTDAGGDTVTEQVLVVPAAPAKLGFPTGLTSVLGQSPIEVAVVDKYGNLTTADDGATLTLHLGPYPDLVGTPSLTGTLTAPVVNGVATFDNVSANQAGRARLVAKAPKSKLRSVRSNIFTNG